MNSVSFTWTAGARLASTTLAALLLVAVGCDNDSGTGSATDAATTEDTTDGTTDGTTNGMTATMTAPTTTTDGTGETEAPPTTTDSAMLGHAADMQPIWDANCTTGCHVSGGTGAGWFSINPEVAYDELVENDSVQIPGMFLITPGDRSTSYLWHKINNTHILEGGSGSVMPQGAEPLSAADIEKIGQWIDGGALP